MASTALAPGLARKLKKVLETRTDSPDLLESLNTLSAFYTENTPQARRNLRAMIEKRGLSLNDEFLRASENAQKALDAVESEVAVLAESCDRIAKAMNSCASVTGDFMAVTEKLKHDLENSNQRLEIVTNFLHNYQLTTEEISALREDDLNENFFKALARVQEIHANCKVLLRTHHQRAGLEMMDMMAVYQEGAYERLCRWVQAECRFLSDSDQPEVRELLKTASRCLKERPVLFKYCAEEVANTRHNALFRRFISALTRGGPGGMPRPIEVHAHDPLRYVGDMLGWLHQALASERELAISLFNPDAVANPKSHLSAKEDKQDGKAETDLTFVLDRVFEGVCRPFKVRVEQVLQSQPGILLAYKLTILLEFYSHTISELLGESSALSVTLKDVRDAAERTFFDTIKARGDKLLRYLPPVPADLSPPPAVAEGVSVLLELIVTYDSMMVPAGGIKPEFEPVMAAMLGPVIEMCERAAETYASKSTVRKSISLDTGRTRKSAENVVTANGVSHHGYNLLAEIFLTNCLYAIQQPLLTKDIGTKFVKALKESIDRHIETMVDHKISAFLERCGLLRKIEFIKKRASQTPVSEIVSKDRAADFDKPIVQVEEMNPVAVSESLRVFFGLLASEGALPEFEQLQDPSLRSEVCNRFGIALADAYELLYNTLLDPLNHYSDARTMLRHTPEQIKTILGV